MLGGVEQKKSRARNISEAEGPSFAEATEEHSEREDGAASGPPLVGLAMTTFYQKTELLQIFFRKEFTVLEIWEGGESMPVLIFF